MSRNVKFFEFIFPFLTLEDVNIDPYSLVPHYDAPIHHDFAYLEYHDSSPPQPTIPQTNHPPNPSPKPTSHSLPSSFSLRPSDLLLRTPTHFAQQACQQPPPTSPSKTGHQLSSFQAQNNNTTHTNPSSFPSATVPAQPSTSIGPSSVDATSPTPQSASPTPLGHKF